MTVRNKAFVSMEEKGKIAGKHCLLFPQFSVPIRMKALSKTNLDKLLYRKDRKGCKGKLC